MFKALGAVMTGAACAYFGFKGASALKKRAASLAEIISSLEMLESEIAFGLSRLSDALMRADTNGFFAAAAQKVGETGARTAWETALDENCDRLCLTDADCDILLTLGKTLGKTDAEDQIKNIRCAKALLGENEKAARGEYARCGKLFCGGGVLVGLMIIIILI